MATQTIPTKYDDIIDSRDVIAAIESLTDILEDDSATDDEKAEAKETLTPLQALATEAEGYASDWQHGETLIRDSHFRDYAQELAEDCGMIKSDASWPYTCIDWDRAARDLQMDYSSVEFDGVTYWTR